MWDDRMYEDEKIKEQQLTIGHLKYLVNDGVDQYKISYTTADKQKPFVLNGTSSKASVIVNARVQTEPETLKKIIYEAIDETELKLNCRLQVQTLSAFQPGFPKPTHRLANWVF